MQENDWVILPNKAYKGDNRCDPGGGWAIGGDAPAISLATVLAEAMTYAGPVDL